MLEFRKQADGTWKRFGKDFADEDSVSIRFGSGNPQDSSIRSVLVSDSVPPGPVPEPGIRHSGVEGEFTYAQAVALVEKMIRDGSVGRNNVVLIEASETRVVPDAFDLAQCDLIARHAHEQVSAAPVPSGFHDYFNDIYRATSQCGSDKPFMSRVGSLELVQLIRERLWRRFSGRICDPAGKILKEWTAG